MRARVATFAELDPATLYDLLRLRTDVFVVEQRCPYAELDGRDTEPGTRHLWIPGPAGERTNVSNRELREEPNDCARGPRSAAGTLAYLRLLAEPDGRARIGRVCTAATARGRGLATQLMAAALDLVGDRECVLDAQTHLVGFYERFGFAVAGAEFLQDGIPHTPMRRDGRPR